MRYVIFLLCILITCQVSAYNGFGKNKVRYNNVKWKVLTTEHFEVYHAVGTEKLARIAASIAEEAYTKVSRDLRHQLSRLIPFIIFKSHYDFQQTNVILDLISPATGGFSEILKFRMVIPFTGSYAKLRRVILHELTHVFTYDILYPEGLESLLSLPNIPPMWLMEGIAEYETGVFDPIGKIMLADAVVENCLIPISSLSDFRMIDRVFLAYQESHSFVKYIADTYGKEKLHILLRKFRKAGILEDVIKYTLGVDLHVLEKNWIKWLRQKYYPEIAKRSTPYDYKGRRLFKENIIITSAPDFSPGGDLAVVTIIKDGTPCVVLIRVSDGRIFHEITKGMRGVKFHELPSTVAPAYSKDGTKIAFVAKQKAKDVIFIWDVLENKLSRIIKVNLDNILYISFSKDSNILILSGLNHGETNIYKLDITTDKLSQITPGGINLQPVASPVEQDKIVFICEEGVSNNLYILNIDTLKLQRLPLPEGVIKADPFWSSDGSIVYCSCLDNNDVYNIWAVNIKDSKISKITDCFGGAFWGRCVRDKIVFTSYSAGDNIVYMMDKPENICWKPTKIEPGKWIKPKVKEFPGKIIKYKTKLTFDWRKVDMLYSSVYGFSGIGEIAISDILGNHRIIWKSDASSSLAGDTNFLLSYLYLGSRASYEIDIFDWTNSYRFMDEQFKKRIYGVSTNILYPLDVFRRIEFGIISKTNIIKYTYPEKKQYREDMNLLSTGLVHDTTVWSWEGPVSGSRARIKVTHAIPISDDDLSFTNVEVDYRKYIKIGKRSVLAFQIIGNTSTGKNKTEFILGEGGGAFTLSEDGSLKRYYSYEFRGGKELRGEAFVKNSIELRFPLINKIEFTFPFSIQNIRSVLFFDIGAAWKTGYSAPKFRTRTSQPENPIRGAFGGGIRAVLGIFPIRVDYAWGTDFVETTPRITQFSIGYDF
jgi:Tol biopolymer transport system component